MARKTTLPPLEQISSELKLAKSKKRELSKAFQDLYSQTSSIFSLTVQWQDLQSHFDAIETSLKNRFQELESKEKEVAQSVEARIKEIEAREREFTVRLSNLESRERGVKSLENSNLKVKSEPVDYDDIGADLRFSVSMDGKALQLFLNERVDVHDKIADEVLVAIKMSLDPAKLVLDAMEGFYPLQGAKTGGNKFELGVVRRSCLLLLEQLLRASPKIRATVREEAKRAASEWKGKMGVDELEVLGVLLLVGVYGLVPEFDKDEIVKLFGVVEEHRLASELCRVLGITDNVAAVNPESSRGEPDKLTSTTKIPRIALVRIRWTPPLDDFVKVNFDGSFIRQNKLGGLGVVVRDKNGKVIAARARKIFGMLRAQVVELWAAREALDLITTLGFNKIVVEGDNLNVIRMLSRKKKPRNDEKDVALDAFRLASKFTSCSFVHIKRMGNEVAHGVSKFAITVNSVKEWKEDIPAWLSKLSRLDIQGSSIIPPAVTTGQSLPQSSQVNNTVASRPESTWPELTSFCINMDGNGLRLYLSEHVNEHDAMQSEVYDALRCASDPVKLVLDAVQGNSSNSDSVESFTLGVSRTSCILLLEQLRRLSPQIEPPIKEEAMKVAVEWKGECSEENENHVKVLGFLQLVATFGLVSSFDATELLCLLKTVYQHERTPDLFRILGLEKKIRKFIRFLIKKKHWLQAIRYIYAFDKVDRFPPIQLLKDHVDYSMTRAKKLCEEGHLSRSEATKEEIDDLRATIKCIADYKLDSEYSPAILEEHIALLEKQNEDEKDTKPAPASNSQSNKRPRTEISTGDSPNTRVRTSSAVYPIQPSTPTTIHSRQNNNSAIHTMQPPQQPESMSTNQGASYPSTTAQQKPEGVFTNQCASYPSTTPQQQQPSMFTDHGAYPSTTALQLQPAGMFTNQGGSYPNITPQQQQPASMFTNQGASYPSTTTKQQKPAGGFTNQGASYPSTTSQQQPTSMFINQGVSYPSTTAQQQPAGVFTNQGSQYSTTPARFYNFGGSAPFSNHMNSSTGPYAMSGSTLPVQNSGSSSWLYGSGLAANGNMGQFGSAAGHYSVGMHTEFDKGEIVKLFGVLEKHRLASELRHVLGIIDNVAGSRIIPPAVQIGESLPQNSQVNRTVASRSESQWPELKSSCINMDGNGLRLFLNKHMKEHEEMQSEVYDALQCASDPVKLVLDATQGNSSNSNTVECFKSGVSRTSCILLLEQLRRLSPQIEPPIKEEARKLAVEWKRECYEQNVDPVKVLGFMQLVATFGLTSSFPVVELFRLLEAVYQQERTPDLVRILGLAKKISRLIHFLIKNNHRLEAIRYIYAFDKVNKFPPIQLLKDHVDYSMTHAKKLCDEGCLAQSEVTKEEIDALRATIKCIADHKLDSEYSPDILEKRIALLEKQNEDEKDTKPAPASSTAVLTGDSPNAPIRTSSTDYPVEPSTSTIIDSRHHNTSSAIHLMEQSQQPASMLTNQGAYHKLDSEYSPDILEKRIALLEMQNEDGEGTEPAPASSTAISTGDSPNAPIRTSSTDYPVQPSTLTIIDSRHHNTSSTIHAMEQPQQPASLLTNQVSSYPSTTLQQQQQQQPESMFTNQGASYPNTTPQQQHPANMFTNQGASCPSTTAEQPQPVVFMNQGASYPSTSPQQASICTNQGASYPSTSAQQQQQQQQAGLFRNQGASYPSTIPQKEQQQPQPASMFTNQGASYPSTTPQKEQQQLQQASMFTNQGESYPSTTAQQQQPQPATMFTNQCESDPSTTAQQQQQPQQATMFTNQGESYPSTTAQQQPQPTTMFTNQCESETSTTAQQHHQQLQPATIFTNHGESYPSTTPAGVFTNQGVDPSTTPQQHPANMFTNQGASSCPSTTTQEQQPTGVLKNQGSQDSTTLAEFYNFGGSTPFSQNMNSSAGYAMSGSTLPGQHSGLSASQYGSGLAANGNMGQFGPDAGPHTWNT